MIAIIYRWKLKPGKEDQFILNWSVVTSILRETGNSLGSRLHKAGDEWIAYAQWTDLETREAADISEEEGAEEARALMKDAIAEEFPEVILEIQSDYLLPAPEKAMPKFKDDFEF